MINTGHMIIEDLNKYGFRAKLVSIDHISEIEEGIEGLKSNGMLDAALSDRSLSGFRYDHAEIMPSAKYILVVAQPQYVTKLNFMYKDSNKCIVGPPAYDYSSLSGIVDEIATTYKCSFIKAKLPAKLLAVRSGLGKYGRNNICYMEGLGSFLQLFTFYTDISDADDGWQAAEVMPECSKCKICIKACPTKCITEERFLIHAENCMTNLNEHAGEFPEWVDKSWHNALVGCIRCQFTCPQNRDLIKKIDAVVDFTKEETQLILDGIPFEELPDALKTKLEMLNITEYYFVLNRNLAVLID